MPKINAGHVIRRERKIDSYDNLGTPENYSKIFRAQGERGTEALRKAFLKAGHMPAGCESQNPKERG